MDDMFPDPKPSISRKSKTVGLMAYEEVLDLVRNTLKIDEAEALSLAGYSSSVQHHWRRDERAPLVAVNALRGLLVGREIERKEEQTLLLSVDDLLTLAGEVRSGSLRAALYREIARRVDPKGGR